MSAEFIPHGGLIRADDLQQGVPLKPSEITQFIRTIDAEVFERKHAAAENTFQPKRRPAQKPRSAPPTKPTASEIPSRRGLRDML